MMSHTSQAYSVPVLALALLLMLGHGAALPHLADAQPRGFALPAEDRSWENDPAVQKMKGHFLMEGDLWSAVTDQVVTKDAFRFFGSPVRLVAGRPDLIFTGDAAWGFALGPPTLASPGSKPGRPPMMEMCVAPGRCTQTGIQPRTGFPGPFLHSDYRRIVYFKAGDVWRAEVDWSSRQIVSHQQVTRVGVLHERKRGDIMPLHWHDNILLLRTQLSRERPILRVNLGTGEIEELAAGMVFEKGMFPNPSGSRLCAPHRELLACYDVRSGETSRVSLVAALDGLRYSGMPPERLTETPPDALWADDETLLLVAERRIVRVDFRNARAEPLFTVEQGKNERVEGMKLTLLPGRRHVAAEFNLRGTTPPISWRLMRIGIEDGSAVPLPDQVHPDGVWIDANRFVYPKRTGGISEIGTWLHDITSDAKRICHVPARLHRSAPDGALFVPDTNALYFTSSVEAGGILRVDLASGECRQVAAQGSPRTLGTPPVDLRFGVTGEALWSSRDAPARPAPPAAGEGPQGLERVLQAIKDLPTDLQDEIKGVYRSTENDIMVKDHYDPACYALEYLKWYHTLPNPQPGMDGGRRGAFSRSPERYAACADRAALVKAYTASADRAVASEQKYTEEQRKRIAACTGEIVADQYVRKPVPNMRYRADLRVSALSQCRKQHGG